MGKKNIIVVGYPKSGTTWAARLVAELVGCPLSGDWGYETIDSLFKEGNQRNSEFQCFKSHHTYNEIQKVSDLKIHKIIYIVRDPRDAVISGVEHFSFTVPFVASFFKKIHANKIELFLKKIFNSLLPRKEKKRQMIKAMLCGNKAISYWLKTSWKDHYSPYLGADILFIKYENLLDTPIIECNKIMNHLNIEVSSKHVKSSIDKQSFNKKKQEYSNSNDSSLRKLLRQGSYGYWKKEFSAKEIDLFKSHLNEINSFYEF